MQDEIPTYDFCIHQGDSWNSGELQRLDDFDLPIADLTGATGLCQLRTSESSGVVATLAVTILDGPLCKYQISAAASVSAAIPAPDSPYTEYKQDVQFSWPSGFTLTMHKGTAYITPEVSR